MDWVIEDLGTPSLGPKESAIVIAVKTNNCELPDSSRWFKCC